MNATAHSLNYHSLYGVSCKDIYHLATLSTLEHLLFPPTPTPAPRPLTSTQTTRGLYYIHITIVNEDSSVISK
jgi:hypothetical protein